LIRPPLAGFEPTGDNFWWRRELARRDAEGRTRGGRCNKTAALVPVHITHGPPAPSGPPVTNTFAMLPEDRSGGHVEIVLPHGRRVRVVGPVDRQALIDVLAALTFMETESAAC